MSSLRLLFTVALLCLVASAVSAEPFIWDQDGLRPCAGGVDAIPPATTTDLHITAYTTSPRTVTLYWTPSGDDGTVGQATGYSVRKRLGEEITEANWETSTIVGDMLPGTTDHITVTDLSGNGFWYFALKATDEECLTTDVSNNDCIKFSPSPLALCDPGKPAPREEHTPARSELAITAVGSNPTAEGGVELSFTLANGSPATLGVFDAAGRRVEARDLSHLGPGVNSLRIGARLATGHYWVRIEQGDRSATREVIVIR